MGLIRELLAWISGEGFCPSCEGKLQAHEAGYRICRQCSAVVDYEKGRWQLAGASQWRRLPGVAGFAFEEDAA